MLMRGSTPALAMVLAAILITIYPMLVLNWHGDPFEIARHAEQIAIQFRLAFWLAVLFIADQAVVQMRQLARTRDPVP